MAFIHSKDKDDPMHGYNMSMHHSPDRNYVPGFGNKVSPKAGKEAPQFHPAVRDALSNLWHTYAKNHSAEPYTKRHKLHNAAIFKHVSNRYGEDVAKAMHGHAEALRQGGIYSIRNKYHIQETEMDDRTKELLNELSPSTLGRYIKHASIEGRGDSYMAGSSHAIARMASKDGKPDEHYMKQGDKDQAKSSKRHKGIMLATNKLVNKSIKEEEHTIVTLKHGGKDVKVHLDKDCNVKHIHGVASGTPEWKFLERVAKQKAKEKMSEEYKGKIEGTKDFARKIAKKHDDMNSRNKKRTIKTWKEFKKQKEKIDESVETLNEIESRNRGYGLHGEFSLHAGSDKADKMYAHAHRNVKDILSKSGHLASVKNPNVTVRNYLDSVRGRHLHGNHNDHEYIKKDFARFMKTYNPADYR